MSDPRVNKKIELINKYRKYDPEDSKKYSEFLRLKFMTRTVSDPAQKREYSELAKKCEEELLATGRAKIKKIFKDHADELDGKD